MEIGHAQAQSGVGGEQRGFAPNVQRCAPQHRLADAIKVGLVAKAALGGDFGKRAGSSTEPLDRVLQPPPTDRFSNTLAAPGSVGMG